MSGDSTSAPPGITVKLDVEDVLAGSLVAPTTFGGLRGNGFRRLRMILGISFLVFAAVNFWQGSGGPSRDWATEPLPLFMFVVGCVVVATSSPAFYRWSTKRMISNNPAFFTPTKFEFLSKELTYSSGNRHGGHSWADFTALEETRLHFFLRVSTRFAVILPKRDLSSNEAASQLRSFLKSRISNYALLENIDQ